MLLGRSFSTEGMVRKIVHPPLNLFSILRKVTLSNFILIEFLPECPSFSRF